MGWFNRDPSDKKALRKLIPKIKYPKLILLALSIFLGYLIYKDENNFHFHAVLQHLGYLGTFLAGLFFVYGFTTGPAVASLLIISNFQNFWLAGVTATLGVIVGNFIVFRAMKISVGNELDELSRNRLLSWAITKTEKHIPSFARIYILPAFAGFIAATPLPDELAVALLSWSKNMSLAVFSTVAFTFNAFGIFIILWIGKMI
ncbi:MAG: hypothetical protein U5L10_03615 [Candidatus Moranbacteria bacterium]|nr:hypothetical protein [Candidatus Moranbacteria bacterium]